jgi:HAD superfamily hydrolase (TIGR01490 family)
MRLALFDFDGTLTHGDTLLPFLRAHCGGARYAIALIRSGPALAAYALKIMRNDTAKEHLLRHAAGGERLQDLRRSGEVFMRDHLPQMLRRDTMGNLAEHRKLGDTCLLVSASLDVYLAPWAQAQGFDAVLCSSLETSLDGRVTGRLQGGNCHGQEKVERVRRWLDGRTPSHVVAYGDSPGDRQMLEFADVQHWIGSGRRKTPQR